MIGLLNAYLLDKNGPSYQQNYGPMFLDFLKVHFPNQEVRMYHVALGELPKFPDECDGWIITGSSKSAYDQDAWIIELGEFVKKVDQERRKLIGVCFGHQLIAHYLGGQTEKAKQGWGVGVRKFDVIQSKTWIKPELKQCSLIFSHQDQVSVLPKRAELLGRDSFCPHQMYSIEDHIFCFQGHPEFTPEFAKSRLDSRIQLVGEETYKRAVNSLSLSTDANQVGEWMRLFLLN